MGFCAGNSLRSICLLRHNGKEMKGLRRNPDAIKNLSWYH